jgi:undecaprenyl diphosphate synthase
MPSDSAIGTLALGATPLRVPQHLAVTMDGNGRWAQARGKPRTEGHRAGIAALRRLVEYCIRYEVAYVTVFSFSSENWSRPAEEVNFIFGLLKRFVLSDLESLIENNVRVRISGSREGLDKNILQLIDKAEKDTEANTGLTLIVAFNYGGKAELVNATRKLATAVRDGLMEVEDITEASISEALYLSDIPEPEVVLRTSGEQRFSNFLLWQAAYSELIFIDEYWPDFNEESFLRVLEEFGRRERRFGALRRDPNE